MTLSFQDTDLNEVDDDNYPDLENFNEWFPSDNEDDSSSFDVDDFLSFNEATVESK